MDRGARWATVCEIAESDMTEQLNTAQHSTISTVFPERLLINHMLLGYFLLYVEYEEERGKLLPYNSICFC